MPNLVYSLLQHGQLNRACQRALEKAATPFHFSTEANMLSPGMVQDKIYFIGGGIAMSHYLTKERQFINWFATESEFAVSVEGFHHQRPSREYLTTCTPVQGVSITKNDYDGLLQDFPPLAIMVRKLTLHYLLQSQLRLHDTTMLDAYERYRRFVGERPDLVRTLPDKLVAAYLNMDPSTYSKMRKKFRDQGGN